MEPEFGNQSMNHFPFPNSPGPGSRFEQGRECESVNGEGVIEHLGEKEESIVGITGAGKLLENVVG